MRLRHPIVAYLLMPTLLASAWLLPPHVWAQTNDIASNNGSANVEARRGFVLLRNDRVLQGDIVAQTGVLVLRRDAGSEIRLPIDQVVGATETMNDLYKLRQRWLERVPESLSPRHSIEDARWCMENKLTGQAEKLLAIAKRADPLNPLVDSLQRRLDYLSRPADTSRSDALGSTNPIAPVSFEQTVAPETIPAIDPWTLQTFSSRVHPVLLAKCGSCHDANLSSEHVTTAWKLELPVHGSRASSRITRENLSATLRFVTPGRIESSDLYQYATAAHGGLATTPILPHESRLIATLQAWIEGLPAEKEPNKKIQRDDQVKKSLSATSTVPDLQRPPGAVELTTSTPATTVRRLPTVAPVAPIESFNRQTELLQAIEWPK